MTSLAEGRSPRSRRSPAWATSVSPGVLSSQCGEGECCATYREHLGAPLPDTINAVAIYSGSDGIVSREACLDPCARHVEVKSSHTGMSVNRDVYRVLAEILEEEERRWSG